MHLSLLFILQLEDSAFLNLHVCQEFLDSFILLIFLKTMTWKTYYLHFKSYIYLFIHVLLPRVWSFLCVNGLHASEKNVYSDVIGQSVLLISIFSSIVKIFY